MRVSMVALILNCALSSCAMAETVDICELVDQEKSSSAEGKILTIKGKGEVYKDSDGTRTFIYSSCRVSYLGQHFNRNVYVLISGVQNEKHIINSEKYYSVQGIFHSGSAPIYAGPTYGFTLESPKIQEIPAYP